MTDSAAPLVSCIMPTKGRPDWLPQAIRYFQKQDYPNCELIIVDASPGDLGALISHDARIRHHRAPPSHTIGTMRNIACEAARGDVIVLWDDDDWYAAKRITVQVQPILHGRADITAVTDTVFFDLDRWEFWRCSRAMHRRIFALDAVCGTVAFRRSLFGGSCRYPNLSAAEDAAFLECAVRQGASLQRVASDGLFAYVRHAGNTWKFECGKFLDATAWRREHEPRELAADRAFYAARSQAMAHAEPCALATPVVGAAGRVEIVPEQPFVSCIMPTANRRRFVPGAIAQFLAQDYPAAELVILDDGDDSVHDLVPSHPALRYLRMPRHRTLGLKRNAACEAAHGDIILHWDDDDWYAPHRIRTQVEALCASSTDLCGIDRALFFDPRAPAAWEYVHPRGGAPWVCGATLCFRREYWRANPFADMNVGEDTRFAAAARPDQLCVLPDNRFFVALVHAANTSPKQVRDPRWQPRPVEAIRAMIGGDWPDFSTASAVLSAAPAVRTAAPGPAVPPATPRVGLPGPDAVPRVMRQGVSVVIPHGGTERLPHLAASLANLRQCSGVGEIIVVDMSETPVVQGQARRWGAKYVFVRNDETFERGRALDVGSRLAMYDLVLWKDNDLLMTGDFIATAASEIRRRALDFLIPYVRINYLSEADSKAVMEGLRDPALCTAARMLAPGGQVSGGAGLVRNDFLRRYGGIPEGFRGWGGEDNAWVHKVALLGSSAISTNRDQSLFHLYHARSGAHDATVHQHNPHYADNLSLLARITGIRDKRQFLERFPASPANCLWTSSHRIVFVAPPTGHRLYPLAYLAAEGLRELLGAEVFVVEDCDEAGWRAGPAERRPDAMVYFDQARGVRLLAQQDLAWLHDRMVIVVDTVAPMPAFDARLMERAAALCVTSRAIGAPVLAHVPTFALPADGADPTDIGVGFVQPLSIVLGAVRSRTNEPGEPAAPSINGGQSMQHPVWVYWEGDCPEWIAACRRTIIAHAPGVRLLDRDGFERIRDGDRDIDIDRLQVAHRADFIRAFLLARYGGLWLDSDCIATRPLTPLLDLVSVHDFIAHRDRQGFFPNGFMGARPGSAIAGEFYRRICGILRSGQRLGWISLGGEPLTELLKSTDVPWHELECELIQPVCWSRPDVFFAAACRDDHERSFNNRAFCYMLSNTEIKKYAARHPELSLMQQDSFFRFLVEKSTSAAVREVAADGAAQRGARIRTSDQWSAAKDRYRTTKLAAEHLSFYLSSIADISPTQVLEVGSELGRWGMLIGDREGNARREGGESTPPIQVHGIQLSPDIGVDLHRCFCQTVNQGDIQAPLNAEDRHWDLVVVSDALNVWPPDVANQLVARATAIADYVLIWDWCEAWRDRGRALASEVGESRPWSDTVRASRIGTVRDCRYNALLLSRSDPRHIGRRAELEKLFETVFHENSRIGDESVSGPGSCLAQTAEIRRSLPHLLQSIGARSLLDAPCGDFNWMKHVVLGLEEYIGVDIVSDLVAENQRRYGRTDRRFIKADLTRDDLPDADVVLCRDCLVHLSYEDIRRAVRNIKRSRSTYFLTTTFPRLQANSDIVTGQWRPLNLQLLPFNFPNPIRIVVEGCTEAGGRYADKSLALWRLSDIG